jgi:oligoendopeptidase F
VKKIIFIGIMVALLGVNSFAKTQKSTDIKGDNMGQKMLTRNEIADKYKWNMKDFYSDWNEWEKDFEKLKSTMKKIPEYRGKIKNNSKNFIELIKLEEQLSRLLDKLYIYVYMLKDINSKDEVASVKLQEIESVYTQYSVSTAWITPEILEIPQETMKKWIDENPEIEDYRFSMMEIYRLQGHVLDEPKEKLLSYYGQYMGAPSDIYGELSISDMKWNEVKLSDGYEGPVTNGIYSKVLSTNRNQEDRKKAFEALYGSFNNNKNTYGAIYRALLQRDVASAQGRNFKSTLERALEGKNVPVKVFQTLLQSAKDNNAPLQRYVKLRKKALNLKEYHYYDNSINIVEYNKQFDYDTAKDMVYKSVAPLGQDYSNKMNIALSEGWIDVFETENKRSGAYSIGVYDVHPFMLLNYQSTMDDVFTLAHELGHTLHTMLSSETQPYALHDYTIFVAEVASTFNERLLLDYMIQNTNDPIEKIALIEQALGNIVGTFYIQSLFADYEYQAHKLVEEGKAVTPDVLSGIMENLFNEYFGDTLTMDELQKIVWSRIPHFFNSPYYVYQYATSFASSANLYDRITNTKYSDEERENAKIQYLTLLKSGGNDHPMNQLKKAGVDLEKEESFSAVAVQFNALLDILEEELNKINK